MDRKHIKNLSISLLLTLIFIQISIAYNTTNIKNNTETQSIASYIQILNLNEANGANFTLKSAEISKKGQTNLNIFVKQIITSGITLTKIIIVGHTDNTRSALANQNLSEQRATAVANHLANQGINKQLMNITGLGSTRPVANNDNDIGRAQNNRIFIQVYGKTD